MKARGARDAIASLANASVILTRPAEGASALLTRVRAQGGQVLRLPGLSLRMPSDARLAIRALRAQARTLDWIFTSPAAVRFAFRLAPTLRLPKAARVFGVGVGTQRALARHGLRANVPHDRRDSEGLLAMPEFVDVRDKSIALVGAAGGRDLIAPTLRRRGAQVVPVHVYERHPPRLTRRHFDAVSAASNPLITLVSSGEALVNLAALLPAPLLARLRHQVLVVSSARLAELAREHAFEDVRIAASAAADDLMEAACKALARHRL